MHVYGDVLGDDSFHEWNEPLGNAAEDDSRVDAGINVREVHDEVGRRSDAAAHGETEEFQLRLHVTQDGRRGDAQLRSDIRERRSLESLFCKNPPCRLQQLVA